MSLHHSFDVQIAKKYGVHVAIFLNHIAHWTERNIANRKNFFDGTFWSYNTHDALLDIFSYWSKKTLRTTIERCEKENLLLKGNYNKTSMDRTIWYAFTDKGMALFPALEQMKDAICRNRHIEMPESAVGSAGIGTAIPDTNHIQTQIQKSSCETASPKAKSRKPKTRKDYKEENEAKPHWHKNAKVCEPVTQDPVICGSCRRPQQHCGCYGEPAPRLPKEIAQAFSKAALARLGRKSTQH